MRTVIVRNGYIWATHSISLPATAPTRSSDAWWQIDPAAVSVVQYGRLDDASGKYFLAFPSIAVTTTNDLLLGTSLLGTTIYASGAYAYRKSSDAINTLRYPKLFISGVSTYYKTFGSGRNRWAITLQPVLILLMVHSRHCSNMQVLPINGVFIGLM